MIKRLFRWAFYLFITCVVLLVAGILLLDTIVREVLQREIRAQTGMDAKIGHCSVSLLSPTVTVENFKLYNTAEFGGSPCVDMPELHLEYDRSALWSRQIHLKLVRLNLTEVVMVNGKPGKSNFRIAPPSTTPSAPKTSFSPKWQFTGIDTLNLTFQKLRITNIETSGQDQEVNFSIKEKIYRNLKKPEDFQAVAFLIAAQGGLDIPIGKTESPAQMFLKGIGVK